MPMRSKARKLAGRTRKPVVPVGSSAGRIGYSKLRCPRCATLCASQSCHQGHWRIFCEAIGCGFVTCSDTWDGLNGSVKPDTKASA